ncbi:hypothetical protein ACH5RR_008418 [Cinchona calisaya]|uniref:Uncharacterized protein n=1 Tax=Cinchona calisaya TaxID=153742 RepID=A0ABD3ABB5_9GENT
MQNAMSPLFFKLGSNPTPSVVTVAVNVQVKVQASSSGATKKSCAHLTSKSDVAIHSSHEHKLTKRSSSQNHSSVPYETRKGDTLDTSIKTLNDARETITKDLLKETEAIPTQNSKGNLTEREARNATIGDSSCHNTCDKEESSESTSGRDRPWNRPKKGNKGNNARDLEAIINSEALIRGVPNSTIPLEQLAQYFDDHEQRVDLVDDTLEEIEVSVTGPSKFDIFSNVVHTSSNANLTKNLEDGINDVTNSQAMIKIENTIMTWRTPPIQTTLLKQPLKTFKPPTWPLLLTVSSFIWKKLSQTINEKTYNSVKASLDGKMTQESCEGLLSTTQKNLRTIEMQEQEQREEKTMVLNQSQESLKKAQVEVAGLREEIQKIENTPRLSEEDVKVLGKMEHLFEEDQNELSSFQIFK